MRKKKSYQRLSSLLIAIILIPVFAYAAHLHPEKAYQQAWCDSNDGVMEVVLSGGSRVDCLTETHAIEVEFAEKWKEAVGQALYYGKKTGRAPSSP